MEFYEYLEDLGMFEDISPDNKEAARNRYLSALRVDVKDGGYVFLKRNPGDVFVNNFNIVLMPILRCNHDLQYVINKYSVANYITGYLTKNEAGVSRLLKHIEELNC